MVFLLCTRKVEATLLQFHVLEVCSNLPFPHLHDFHLLFIYITFKVMMCNLHCSLFLGYMLLTITLLEILYHYNFSPEHHCPC